mgnify:FL=1
MKVLPIVVAGTKFLQDYKKSRALDYGAGTGRNSIYLANLGIEVLAVDQDIEDLEKLAINNKLVYPVKADLRDWEIQGKFDLVVATNVLQFFDNDTATRCLMNITNCLINSGVLCLTYILDKKISLPIGFEAILTSKFEVINSGTKIIQDPGHPDFPEPHQHKIFYFLGIKK